MSWADDQEEAKEYTDRIATLERELAEARAERDNARDDWAEARTLQVSETARAEAAEARLAAVAQVRGELETRADSLARASVSASLRADAASCMRTESDAYQTAADKLQAALTTPAEPKASLTAEQWEKFKREHGGGSPDPGPSNEGRSSTGRYGP